MNNKTITLLSFLFLYAVLSGCKKESKPTAKPVFNPTQIKKISVDSVTSASFVITYQFDSSSITQTSVILSLDSALLVSGSTLTSTIRSKYNSTTQSYSCQITGLLGHLKYYYRISWVEADGSGGSSPIYSQSTPASNGFAAVGADPFFSGGGNYFMYNNKIYINHSSQQTQSFADWDPVTNQWQQLPAPPPLQISSIAQGHLINNTIYFEPSSFTGNLYPYNAPDYRERLVTYTPQTGKWQTITLNDTTTAGGLGLYCYTAFVFNNKLYCVIQQANITVPNPVSECLIKIFDPANNSWTKMMDINLPYVGSCRSVSFNNNIYLLISSQDQSPTGNGAWLNHFYQFAVANQLLTAKNVAPIDLSPILNGPLNPYFFVYNNKFYLWGGQGDFFSGGALPAGGFLVYDPPTDAWTVAPIPGNTRASALGFAYVVNNKVYIGMGEDGLVPTNAIYNVNL